MRNVLCGALVGALVATTTWAQTPAAPAPPATPATPARAAAPASPVAPGTQRSEQPSWRNVRFDIIITESGGPKPVTKTISVTVGDFNGQASVRNSSRDPGAGSLNADVRGVSRNPDGSIRANVNVEYQPYIPEASTQPTAISGSANAVFQDGRKIQILQTSDPLSDRRTTIEVTATIVK